VIKKTILI